MESKTFKSIRDLPKTEYFSAGHRLCQGCPEGVIARLVTKVLGPYCIIVTPTGCLEVSTSVYPETAWKVPWIHVAFENAAAVASGIEVGIKALKKRGLKFADREINVVVLAGDGGTADIGFQALSGALERGHDFVYICMDNEAYMNTGIQRSGTTPFKAWTTTTPVGTKWRGKFQFKKDMASIVAAHGIPYVAVASISHPIDFANKVKKAAEIEGPAYIHVLAPCPTGWRFDPSKTIEVARLGVLTGMWILYEIEENNFRVTVPVPKRRPVRDYLMMQGRFRHLNDDEIAEVQRYVDEQVERVNKLAGHTVIGPLIE
ncbi:MAG: pyruvate synthase subunit PorB [Candidatus Nezhaarchaeales archaeon]